MLCETKRLAFGVLEDLRQYQRRTSTLLAGGDDGETMKRARGTMCGASLRLWRGQRLQASLQTFWFTPRKRLEASSANGQKSSS
jgi:hypothetical protein